MIAKYYTHKRNGDRYKVLLVTNTEATKPEWPVTVVYQSTSGDAVWSLPMDSFLERFEPDWER